jgi:hypothetical protein
MQLLALPASQTACARPVLASRRSLRNASESAVQMPTQVCDDGCACTRRAQTRLVLGSTHSSIDH